MGAYMKLSEQVVEQLAGALAAEAELRGRTGAEWATWVADDPNLELPSQIQTEVGRRLRQLAVAVRDGLLDRLDVEETMRLAAGGDTEWQALADDVVAVAAALSAGSLAIESGAER